MSVSKNGNWVRLGDYINRSMVNNSNLQYGVELIEGVNSSGEFCPPKANTTGINLMPYKIVQNGYFVYNPSRLNIGSLAYRTNGLCIVSHLYVVFHLNELGRKKLIPEFLLLYFKRKEFLRLIDYLNFGSQRPEFNFFDMSEIQIPLPDIETQQELVDTYNGLKALAEQNEALIKPLSDACQAYIVDCKQKYPEVSLGEYIEACEERNRDLSITLSQGISNLKYFQEPKQVAANSTNDKIVRKGQFAYNRATTRNGEKISIAYRVGEDCTVSSAYQIFKIIDSAKLNPYFLWMWFKRSEFDRYARYMSKGSAHEFFEFDEMCRVKIPLPPQDVQQAIVNIYNCAEEAKKIATEAREKMKRLCPALVQRAING